MAVPTAFAQEFPEYGVKVETVAKNLEVPWSIAFSPDERIFVTERGGKLRVIQDGNLSAPIASFMVGGVEGGLLGIALDPKFSENHYLYLFYTYNDFLNTYNKVSRFTEHNNKITDEVILVDKIPGSAIHDGGRIKFGPDGKLYITTGDAGNAALAQDVNSLAGKILRINSDGTFPTDNPFDESPVYSLGHRNPQGLDWDVSTKKLVATEHGPSGERGFAHDEVNLIESGKNYGWPKTVGDEVDPKFIPPILHTGDKTWAPSGAVFYNSDKIPSWNGKYFVATLRGEHLRIIEFDFENNTVVSSQPLFSGEFGRLREVNMGPDGYLYILTSNRDGRGNPGINDDKILKVIPIPENLIDRAPSPKKQMQSGVDPHMIQCNEGLKLIFKASGWVPSCVKISSYQKLIDIGWASDHNPDDHMINMSK